MSFANKYKTRREMTHTIWNDRVFGIAQGKNVCVKFITVIFTKQTNNSPLFNILLWQFIFIQ